MRKKILSLIIIIIMLILSFAPHTVNAITIYPGINYSIYNTNYSVNLPITFTSISIGLYYMQFNDIKFYVNNTPTTKKVNISINSIVTNTTTSPNGILLADFNTFAPVTMSGIIKYNITGFTHNGIHRYTINAGTDNFVTSDATGKITISYTAAVGSYDRFRLYTYGSSGVIVETNDATIVEETSATLHGTLISDSGASSIVKYEYNEMTGDNQSVVYGTNYVAQTFTSSISHNITGIQLFVRRWCPPNPLPGLITLSIYSVDASHKPTGMALCSSTINGDTSLSTAFKWVWFNFTAPYLYATGGTEYAMVLSAPAGTVISSVGWYSDLTWASYAGGRRETSSNSGTTWVTSNNWNNTWSLSSASSNYITFNATNIAIAGKNTPEGLVHNNSLPSNCITWVIQTQGGLLKSWYRDRNPIFNTLLYVDTASACRIETDTNCILINNNGTDCLFREYGNTGCSVKFEYGFTTGYGTSTPWQAKAKGQTFEQALTLLTQGRLYHFRAYADNGNGSSTGIDYEFLTKPNAPTAITKPLTDVGTNNNQTATWTKGSGTNNTVIRALTAGYPMTPTQGTNIYNNTGTTTIVNNIILLPGQLYYIKAWSYTNWGTRHQFSDNNITTWTLTKPYPPFNTNTSLINYTTDYRNVKFNWTKGTGSQQTIIVDKITGYPVSITDGTIIYLGTGDNFTYNVSLGPHYIKAFGYCEVISPDTGLWWGEISDNGTMFENLTESGFIIYCYDVENGANLTFDVLITNPSGSDTYIKMGCTNPTFINPLLCPSGENTQIIVSSPGYRQMMYVINLYPGIIYTLNTYLPRIIDNSTGINETHSFLYYFQVISEYPEGITIKDAYVQIKKYVDSTGDFTTVSSMYTDSNGFFNCYMITDTLYKIIVTKIGFEDEIVNFIPRRELTDFLNIIKLTAISGTGEDVYIFPIEIKSNAYLETSTGRLYINYTDNLLNTTNCQIYVFDMTDGIFIYNYTSVLLNTIRIDIIVNTSHDFEIIFKMNHSYFGYKTWNIYLEGYKTTITTMSKFDLLFLINFGYCPVGWSNLITWFILLGCFFSFDRRNTWMIMFLIGFLLLLINYYIGFNTTIALFAGGAIPLLIILFGILMLIRDRKSFGVDI